MGCNNCDVSESGEQCFACNKKTMKLGEKQELFMRLLSRLIDKVHELGFEIRGGDLFRDPRVHGEFGEKKGYGASRSCHKLKLAIDLNLTRDGVFLTDTDDHREIGEYWKKQHHLCRWGGDFHRPDGNHYSIEHYGVS